MDFIYLSGSEDVLNASNRMKEAAAEMTRAANVMHEASTQFQRDVDRLIDRLDYMDSPAARAVRESPL